MSGKEQEPNRDDSKMKEAMEAMREYFRTIGALVNDQIRHFKEHEEAVVGWVTADHRQLSKDPSDSEEEAMEKKTNREETQEQSSSNENIPEGEETNRSQVTEELQPSSQHGGHDVGSCSQDSQIKEALKSHEKLRKLSQDCVSYRERLSQQVLQGRDIDEHSFQRLHEQQDTIMKILDTIHKTRQVDEEVNHLLQIKMTQQLEKDGQFMIELSNAKELMTKVFIEFKKMQQQE